jgi:ribosome biogenesis GTPase / thiamine phosphate phosphatase
VTAHKHLNKLGFDAFFRRQLMDPEASLQRVARVIQVQRDTITVADGRSEYSMPLGGSWFRRPPLERPTVGDWVLLDTRRSRVESVLERRSAITRIAAGGRGEIQIIAANVDVLFIVTSCNEEFNLSRLERYLALALEAAVEPVVILTKTDLCDAPDIYADAARGLRHDLSVECVNALDAETLSGLRRWCQPGRTVALIGSSGVGKSTLVNSLAGRAIKDTAPVREADSRGRHTTSYRALHRLPGGVLVLDAPGIRELGIGDADAGVAAMFDDIETLAARCRFSNCSHAAEPGCAVRQALAGGLLDKRRFRNYRKLRDEQIRNAELLARRGRPARTGRRRQRSDGPGEPPVSG